MTAAQLRDDDDAVSARNCTAAEGTFQIYCKALRSDTIIMTRAPETPSLVRLRALRNKQTEELHVHRIMHQRINCSFGAPHSTPFFVQLLVFPQVSTSE